MSLRERINAANEEALRRIVAADPVLVDVAPASEVIPGLRDRMILHSGPPVAWDRMCGAQRGAAIGMCLFEGWANDPAEAERLLNSGEIALEPNHHHATVGAHGRYHHPQHVGVGRRKQSFWKPGLLPPGGKFPAVR